MTKSFARGDKKATAIRIIEENLDKDFFEVADMIARTLDLNKYAGRAYYKYMIKHGLISKYKPDDKPWLASKAAKRTSKPAKVAKPKADFVKKSKPTPVTVDLATVALSEPVIEKPATAMIREFVKKQKAAARSA